MKRYWYIVFTVCKSGGNILGSCGLVTTDSEPLNLRNINKYVAKIADCEVDAVVVNSFQRFSDETDYTDFFAEL